MGDGGVGKTSLVDRLVGKVPKKKYLPTRGVEGRYTTLRGVSFLLWDVGGQDKMGRMMPSAHVDAVIFVYDGSSLLSRKNLRCWKKKALKKCGDVPYFVVCNKSDQPLQKTPSSKELCVSALSGQNVDRVSESLITLF